MKDNLWVSHILYTLSTFNTFAYASTPSKYLWLLDYDDMIPAFELRKYYRNLELN